MSFKIHYTSILKQKRPRCVIDELFVTDNVSRVTKAPTILLVNVPKFGKGEI